MQVHPIDDPLELAEIARCLGYVPVAEGAYNRAHRGQDGRAYGVTATSGPPPVKSERLREKEARGLNEAFGQGKRVLRVRCGKCDRFIAHWQHVIGTGTVSREDWERRREVWGDAGAEPWRGWIINNDAQAAFRDYWDGQVVMNCPNCYRPRIEIGLQRIRVRLAASRKTELLELAA
jgi:hypothetical protein